MDCEQLKGLTKQVIVIGRKAGDEILKISRSESLGIESKDDGTPLTLADLASNKVIMKGLENLTPSFAILSEESDPDEFSLDQSNVFWCVDPLDGTKEFVSGTGEYTVNIALVEDGVPILGVIVLPDKDETYYASRGAGAYLLVHELWDERDKLKPSAGKIPRSAVVSRSHLDTQTEEFLKQKNITDVKQFGSSLKICAVATGQSDIYPRFGPTCLWDTAAGTAIALEAGCDVLGLDKKTLKYNPQNGIKVSGFIVCPKGMNF